MSYEEARKRLQAEVALVRLLRAVRAVDDCPVTPELAAALAAAEDTLDAVNDPAMSPAVLAAMEHARHDQVTAIADIVGSGASDAFTAQRVEQLIKYGHTPAKDREGPLDRLPRAALERVKHALDKLSPGGGDVDYALKKIEIAGACLAAAWDVLRAAKGRRDG